MATRIEKYTIPAKQGERKIPLCDFCGREGNSLGGDWTWTEDNYDVKVTAVGYKTGSSYPEGGSGTTLGVDACPECFMDKVKPKIEELGVEFHETEWWW
jgi:hypothetical protein